MDHWLPRTVRIRRMSANPFQLTQTKIQCFALCRKQYWFRYVSGERWPEKLRFPGNVVGVGVHEALRVLCETDEPADAREHLDRYLRMPIHEMAGPGTQAYEEALTMLDTGVEAHRSIDSANRWAERDSWIPSRQLGISVRGKADRVDRLQSGEWQVIDWKTGKGFLDVAVDLQLDISGLVLRSVMKLPRETPVTVIGWNLRSGERRVRVLDRADASSTMRYLARLAQTMQTTTEFETNPNPLCRFCEWQERCEDSQPADVFVDELMADGWDDAAEEPDAEN